MRILLVNDDGYDSDGIIAVADLLKGDHEIAVVAPDVQKSGFSHSITLKPQSLVCRKVLGRDYLTYAVSGTPVDCVKLGVTTLFPSPDLVVSGINNGRNLGIDILYSGTVSAASDAALLGYRAIALSLKHKGGERADYDRCARFFVNNLDALKNMPLPHRTCLNINFPSGEAIGVKTVKMCAVDTFVDVYDGKIDDYSPNGHRDYELLDTETDEAYCRNGYITVTPITVDRTDYNALEKLKGVKLAL